LNVCSSLPPSLPPSPPLSRATDEGRNLEVNPLLEWNDSEAEKTPEEKEASAAALAAAREKGLDTFRNKWQVWVPEEEGREEGGEKVVSAAEARERWGEEGAKRGLSDPKVLLRRMREENERWAARMAGGGGGRGGGGKRR